MAEHPTDAQMDELLALHAKATPGLPFPWKRLKYQNTPEDDCIPIHSGDDEWIIAFVAGDAGENINGPSEVLADYIVAACNLAPGLVDRVRELENELSEARQVHVMLRGQYDGMRSELATANESLDASEAENASLTQKVAELEAENARLREALERIFLMDKCPSPGDGCSQCIARSALAPAPAAPKEDHA